MDKSEFVPYEVSWKLKKAGFNEKCSGVYKYFGDLYKVADSSIFGYPKNSDKLYTDEWVEQMNKTYEGYDPDEICTAPTWRQVILWFIEKGYNIWVDCSTDRKWLWTVNRIDIGDYYQSDDINLDTLYGSYELAQIAGIEYALTLL